jgi:Holliday junction resolvase
LKRFKRNPEKFEVIDLFTALGRDNSYKLAVKVDSDDFIERVAKSLKSSFENETLKHGKRIEALFAQVAGALGKCSIIKQEDSGALFSDREDIQAPDYSIILKDGRRYFVEVKNCHFPNYKSNYSLNKNYVEKLENYAAMHGAELKFAIYFSHFNKWVLLSKELLIEQKRKFAINYLMAMTRNEMATLGDRTICVQPDLSVELIADREKDPKILDDGQASFIISDVKFYCAGKEILNQLEKNIAFYLVRFGNWIESDAEVIQDGEDFLGARFIYSPEIPNETQEWNVIGDLSSMVSRAYNEHTVYERSVIALDTKFDPEVYSVEIPDGYKGEGLPLLQMIIKPNTDFNAW